MARPTKPRTRAFSLSAYLRRTSLSRGLLGDNPFWRAVFVVVFGRRLVRRLMGHVPETVAVETLLPGNVLQIAAIDPREAGRGRRRR